MAHGAILASVRQRTARGSQESVIRRNLASYKRYLLWDIEQVFSKLKALLRKADERTVPTLRRRLGKLLDSVTAAECANFLLHSGYGSN